MSPDVLAAAPERPELVGSRRKPDGLHLGIENGSLSDDKGRSPNQQVSPSHQKLAPSIKTAQAVL